MDEIGHVPRTPPHQAHTLLSPFPQAEGLEGQRGSAALWMKAGSSGLAEKGNLAQIPG